MARDVSAPSASAPVQDRRKPLAGWLNRWPTIMLVFGVGIFAVWLFFHQSVPYPGNVAPDITVYSLQRGIPYRLNSFRGRWVLLNFWTTWCPPCRAEFPALVKLWESLQADATAGTRWEFLWVNVAEPENTVRRFLREIAAQEEKNPEDWPVFLDPSGQAGRRYGVWAYPETFLIDPSGRIVERVIGPQAWDRAEWKDKLRRLAAGTALRVHPE